MSKISQIDLFRVDIECKTNYKISLMETTWARNVFIRITADSGAYGWGEASPLWALTGETQDLNVTGAAELARLLLGKDPTDIEGRISEMQAHLVHNSTLHSAFDMALYDLLGKIAGQPLYRLFGGGRRSFETDNTVFMAEPEAMAETAGRYVQDGFTSVKVKLGSTAEQDVEIIERIRKAVGPDVPLRIDANQAWDYKTALVMLKALEPFGIQLCEQPVPHWDHESLKQLRHVTTIPIVADEALFTPHDALRLAAGGCCDYFNIKLSKSGGLYNALRINAVAESAGIACMAGCMSETRLGLSAAAHLVSARNNFRFIDLDSCFVLKDDPITGGIRYQGGTVEVPEHPGHGADVKPDFLKNCPCQTIS